MRLKVTFNSIVLFTVLIPTSLHAHVPTYIETNTSFESAFQVHKPTKSWVTYGDLKGGREARWFSCEFEAGDPMIFELFVSPDSDPDFAPQLAILGPGIAPSGKLPNGMNPQGLPASLHSGVRNKEPDLEPATPARQYFLLRTEFPAPNSGKYYAVVFSGIVGGKFGLAIGAMESFTLLEWIRIPLAVIGTYRWEGQSIALVFLPFVLILTFGLLIMLTRQKLNDWAIRLGVLAGWIFLGSAALYGTQVLFKIVSARAAEKWLLLFPFVILLTQILLAIGVMRSSLRKKPVRTAIYGFLGLIAWAGYIVGPTMAVLSAVAIASRAKQRAWKV